MKASPFQVGIVIFFIAFIVLAVLIFTGIIGKSGGTQAQTATGSVIFWGTYPQDVMGKLFSEYNAAHQTYSVVYVQVNATDLDTKLSDAIASGTGPDIVMLGQDQILKNQAKFFKIPYASLSQSTFRSTYIQEGELFMLPDGIVGLPFTVDPLIMFYNRNIFEGAGVIQPPKTWDELTQKVPLITKKDANLNLLQSAVPFGIYGNLNHARDIISMLLLQAGNPIVTVQSGTYIPALSIGMGQSSVSSAQAVVNFLTQFVDPGKDTYTWNRSFTNARDQFISEELAVYLGYASELPLISAKNPNLNFDVTKVPQASATATQLTFGRMNAIAIVKASKNTSTALVVAADLTSADFESKLVDALALTAPVAPARRDLLTKIPQTIYGPTLFNSAIIARGWYDPGQELTDPIFNDMVDSVVRGAADSASAVGAAQSRFSVIFGK
jgi:ABC-type glycerol-3-phosphate transport system substrate-binding protein